VLYGAAQFSKDVDLLVLADPENLELLGKAMASLEAEPIAVPPLTIPNLLHGHAAHFRCRREDVAGLRVDVMSTLRGLDPFEDLWRRRNTVIDEGEPVDMLAREDLVKAKKTQRSKDWPMIERLVEQSYASRVPSPDPATVEFWLRELRSPDALIEVTRSYPELASAAATRPAVAAAIAGDPKAVRSALSEEQAEHQEIDRLYWEPLKRELEEFRRQKRQAESLG
jgi:hypothetical protein